MRSPLVTLVSATWLSPLARLSVSHAQQVGLGKYLHVLDCDGSYRPVADETILTVDDLRLPPGAMTRHQVLLEPEQLVRWLHPHVVRAAMSSGHKGRTVLALRPGVVLLTHPAALLDAHRSTSSSQESSPAGLSVVTRGRHPVPDDGLWPTTADMLSAGGRAPEMFALHGESEQLLEHWERCALLPVAEADRWLDLLSHGVHTEQGDETLVSAWNLTTDQALDRSGPTRSGLSRDGRPVVALDLTCLDPQRPWLLDSRARRATRGRLSEHPQLAELVADLALEAVEGYPQGGGDHPLDRMSTGDRIHPVVRDVYRAAWDALAQPGTQPPPDPFDPSETTALRAWLTDPAADGGPGLLLTAIHAARTDLQNTFPGVPGEHDHAFLDWARDNAVREGLPESLVLDALARTPGTRAYPAATGPREPGVNVVGFLRGELGIGESARLMVDALITAGVPHLTVAVDRHLASRQRLAPERPPAPQHAPFSTSLLCVNADLTPAIAAMVPELLHGSHRVGMWYWEVEDFPTSQHGGFDHVDEVWVATDFVRRAVEPWSPVPVHTMTPPLPQRRDHPTLTRRDLGLPEGPLFLFSFDYLSTVERKNPLGVVEAFRRAFPLGSGPVLVIKSINAALRAPAAERLRVRVASMPDVLLLEDYLDADHRDALVAQCDCYVSLHRSEGLGLTMAEAMAQAKPVIATGYSGNLDFMTAQNSYLVPWAPTPIPPDADPYPEGGTWAEPDLDAAAALMQHVVDDPDDAADRGRRAAADIATAHSPEASGRRLATRVQEIAEAQQRERPRRGGAARLVRLAHRNRN